MNDPEKLSTYQFTEWLLEVSFIQYQCQITIYYKYAPDGGGGLVSYIDECVYWYTPEALVKYYVENIGKRFHVNFLRYAHWFMSIRIFQMKDYYISVYQDRYTTYRADNYLDTATVKTSTKFYTNTLPSYMIFTMSGSSTCDEQVEKLTRGFNIHYRDCIGSLIYLLSRRVDFSFALHKLAKFSSSPGKVYFEVLVRLWA